MSDAIKNNAALDMQLRMLERIDTKLDSLTDTMQSHSDRMTKLEAQGLNKRVEQLAAEHKKLSDAYLIMKTRGTMLIGVVGLVSPVLINYIMRALTGS